MPGVNASLSAVFTLSIQGAGQIDTSLITLAYSGTANCTLAVSGAALTSRTATVSGCAGEGTAILLLAAGVVTRTQPDGSLRQSAASASEPINVSNTAPAVAIASPTSGTTVTILTNSALYAIAGTCDALGRGRSVVLKSDGSTAGLAQTGGFCDGVMWTATLSTAGLTPTSAGSLVAHTLTATLADTIGNARTSGAVTLSKDIRPAIVTISNPSQSGSFATGTVNDLTFSVSNTSNLIAATGVSFAPQTGPFSVHSNSCGAAIAPGATCTYVLRFSSPGERLNGNGVFTTSVAASYNNGNALANAIVAVSQSGIPATVTVAPVYSNGAPWTAYVNNDGPRVTTLNGTGIKDILAASNTTCDGIVTNEGYSHCIHGGELKKVALPVGVPCGGLSLAEALGGIADASAFNWKCVDVAGTGTFYSTGLQEAKGLRDLVNATSWKNNQVLVSDGTYHLYRSAAAAWWTNPVAALPSATGFFGTAYTVYTLSADNTYGYFFSTDHLSVVTLAGAKLGHTGVSSLIDYGHNYSWLEVDLAGATSWGIDSAGTFLQLRNSNVHVAHSALALTGNSSLFYRSRLNSDNNQGIISSGGAHDNTFFDVQSADSKYYGIVLAGTHNTIFTQLHGGGHDFSFLLIQPSSDNITISHLTTANNLISGIDAKTSANSANLGHINISQAISANNGSGGFSFYNSLTNANHLVATNNGESGIKLFTHAQVSLTGTYMAGNNAGAASADCKTRYWSADGNGIEWNGSTCANVGETYAYSPGRTLASSLLAQTAAGTGASADYSAFTSLFTYWGKDSGAFPSVNNRSYCTSGVNCAPWDLRLKATDPVLLNSNGAFSPGSACPAAAYDTLADNWGHTYLVNAIEVPGTGGNLNGLCESGETCAFSPNVGAYQGESVYTAACNYDNAGQTVQNVKMLGHATNGL